jgi:fructose-1,6-bisphosphatase/inositol monophosphatase family enzyme
MTPDLEVPHEGVCNLVRYAARAAILPRFGRIADHEIVEKTPGEMVTSADRHSEEILSEGLAALLPGSRVVGEEACAENPALLERLDEGLVWIVDPLDGTPNFAASKPPFGIIVALAESGRTVAGWLYDPLADRICFAFEGRGAWLSHGSRSPERLTVKVPNDRPVASLATQFMAPDIREAVILTAEESYDLRPIPRCAAEHYPRLCLGENDVALFQRTLPWDHAAGALLLSEAGGHVARWSGKPYIFHDDDAGILAATSEELWHDAARVLFADARVQEQARTLIPQSR